MFVEKLVEKLRTMVLSNIQNMIYIGKREDFSRNLRCNFPLPLTIVIEELPCKNVSILYRLIKNK